MLGEVIESDDSDLEESDTDSDFGESDSDVEEIDSVEEIENVDYQIVHGELTDLQKSQLRHFATMHDPPSQCLRSRGKHPSRDISVHFLYQI